MAKSKKSTPSKKTLKKKAQRQKKAPASKLKPAKKTKPVKKATNSRSTKKLSRKSAEKSIWGILLRWGFALSIWVVLAVILYTAWIAHDLPARFQNPNIDAQPSITFLADNDTYLTRYGSLRGDPVTANSIPADLVNAILAIEDRHFYTHWGVNPLAILRAAIINMRAGHVVQGGSTITQQLAKNLFLQHDRTINRKIREVLASIWLEYNFTKDEILAAYINNVYMGAGIYGMQGAAQYYFKSDLNNITLYQSAILAGMLKAPSRYAPSINPELSRDRAAVVLGAMVDTGYITKKMAKQSAASGSFITSITQHDHLDQAPSSISNGDKEPKPEQEKEPKPEQEKEQESEQEKEKTNTAQYFTDYALDYIDQYIPTPDQNIVIHTTLDPLAQNIAQNVLSQTIDRQGDTYNVQQGAVIVMSASGQILAMVGGKNYQKSQFNRAVQANRQPGSAFKPIIYLASLLKGWSPDDDILDAPITKGDYRPKNFANKYDGQITLRQALAHSSNTAAIRLTKDIGLDTVIDTAQHIGITAALPRDLSLALGSASINLLEMTSAYAVFANGGHAVIPNAITQIKTSHGHILYASDTNPSIDMPLADIYKQTDAQLRIFKQNDIDDIDDMLRGVIEDGTAKRLKDLPFPVSGKTGTSQSHKDAWFIGYAGNIVIGIWLGNDDNTPMIGKSRSVTGGNLPVQIWKDIARELDNQSPIYATALRQSNHKSWSNSLGSIFKRLLSGDSDSDSDSNNTNNPVSTPNQNHFNN